jgi:hypothetical protein
MDWKVTVKIALKRMLKKIAVASFEAQHWQFSVQTKEKHKTFQTSVSRSRYEPAISGIRNRGAIHLSAIFSDR